KKSKNIGLQNKNLLSLSYGKIKNKDFNTSFGLLPASFETYQIVNNGNIILRLTDLQNDKKSLRVGLVTQTGIITSAYLCLEFRNWMNPFFSYYLLHTYDISKVFYWYGGGLRSTMKFDDIKVLPFLTPPLHEQKAIANYLDTKTAQFDRKIDLLTQKAIQYGKLKQSLINETVTRGLDKTVAMKYSGVEWIGEVPEHWEINRIKEVSIVVNGATPKSSVAENWDGELSWVTTDDLGKLNTKFITDTKRKITEKGYASCGATICPVGSVVISGRAPIGHIGILSIKASSNQGCKTLVLNHKVTNNLYIYYSLLSSKSKLEALGRGTTFIELSTKELGLFNLPMPSLAEQKAITDYLDTKTAHIDSIIETINTQIDKLKELRKTLINDVVTGKIKVAQS
ncbi:MAG: restriction endonuclease subunit S, partial [ANME-2 cluster archaeon]|nr:restriction endonuclease subunit S [ANME-2 cluster archaeon]